MSNRFCALQARLQTTLPMASIVETELPELPEIRLGLINDNFPTGPLPEDVMRAVIAQPAYWAFCWVSGLALAQFLLEQPDWVSGKSVIDLGSGSGVAGIAAALAGAAQVIACDTDADARLATEVNATLNDVDMRVAEHLPERCDVLLMADVLYDKQNLPLLALAQQHADTVLVADSRVTTLPDPAYRQLTTIQALTFPNLGEFDEFNTAHVFAWHCR